MDRDEEILRIVERIEFGIEHVKTKLDNAKVREETILANQTVIITKLDLIIQNTTPVPSDDITSLGGSISQPVKQP